MLNDVNNEIANKDKQKYTNTTILVNGTNIISNITLGLVASEITKSNKRKPIPEEHRIKTQNNAL